MPLLDCEQSLWESPHFSQLPKKGQIFIDKLKKKGVQKASQGHCTKRNAPRLEKREPNLQLVDLVMTTMLASGTLHICK